MKKIIAAMLPALTLSLATPALAHAVGDTGTDRSGDAPLVGAVLAPVDSNGTAADALTHANGGDPSLAGVLEVVPRT